MVQHDGAAWWCSMMMMVMMMMVQHDGRRLSLLLPRRGWWCVGGLGWCCAPWGLTECMERWSAAHTPWAWACKLPFQWRGEPQVTAVQQTCRRVYIRVHEFMGFVQGILRKTIPPITVQEVMPLKEDIPQISAKYFTSQSLNPWRITLLVRKRKEKKKVVCRQQSPH